MKTKEIILISYLIASFYALDGQVIFKNDSCFLNAENGMQKLRSFENNFLKSKKAKKGYILCKKKEEFIKQFHSTEPNKLDSIINIINFDNSYS